MTIKDPSFSLQGYRALLLALRGHGYSLVPVTTMKTRIAKSAHIRHDVDLHLYGVDRIARIEADLGVSATYYILMTGPYNPLSSQNLAVLKTLLEMGHEIGLHYDLQIYPESLTAASERINLEIALLEHAVGCEIRTIVRHQPYLGGTDPFKQHSKLLNAHDPAYESGMIYVSDSCRLWRKDSTNRIFSMDPEQHLHLSTHPELWLDESIADPRQYIEKCVIANSVRYQTTYFRDDVIPAWLSRHTDNA